MKPVPALKLDESGLHAILCEPKPVEAPKDIRPLHPYDRERIALHDAFLRAAQERSGELEQPLSVGRSLKALMVKTTGSYRERRGFLKPDQVPPVRIFLQPGGPHYVTSLARWDALKKEGYDVVSFYARPSEEDERQLLEGDKFPRPVDLGHLTLWVNKTRGFAVLTEFQSFPEYNFPTNAGMRWPVKKKEVPAYKNWPVAVAVAALEYAKREKLDFYSVPPDYQYTKTVRGHGSMDPLVALRMYRDTILRAAKMVGANCEAEEVTRRHSFWVDLGMHLVLPRGSETANVLKINFSR